MTTNATIVVKGRDTLEFWGRVAAVMQEIEARGESVVFDGFEGEQLITDTEVHAEVRYRCTEGAASIIRSLRPILNLHPMIGPVERK